MEYRQLPHGNKNEKFSVLGLGILVGLWLESGFLVHCIGYGFIIFGCSVARKK